MSDQSTYLAWSKTVEGVKYRAFAFTEGCGRPDCEACKQAAAEGNPPIWAVFMQPRPDRDEWCLSVVATGHFQGDSRAKLEDAVRENTLTDGEPDPEWCKLAALTGVSWSAVAADPFGVARTQKDASDEFSDDGPVAAIFHAATEEQLREVRSEWRDGGGASFGRALGRIWWELIKQAARKRRGK